MSRLALVLCAALALGCAGSRARGAAGQSFELSTEARRLPVRLRRLTNLEPMNRIKRGRDVLLIIRERAEQAFPHAIQRHIVIARDCDNRPWKLSAARDFLHVLAS